MMELNSMQGRLAAYLKAMVIEHNAVNLLRENFHQISPQAYRSSQPTPGQIHKRAKEYGIKTVVCLRGFGKNSALEALEREACEKEGVKFILFRAFSRAVPKTEMVRDAIELFETIEYPVMFHCKSGSDRVGLMSTLYLHLHEGIPLDQTDQLKFWPYGHIKGAKTGILDHFFECYLKASEDREIGLLEWMESEMDREEIKKSFQPSWFSNLLVDHILNRG